MAFTPLHSAPAFLAFLATLGAGLLATSVAAVALLAGRHTLARKIALFPLALAAVYGGVLLAVSFASEQKVLAPGEQKYFCEVDCHLAYSVVGVTNTRTLGAGGQAATAEGNFYVVTLKVWFDERTVTPRRPRELALGPNPRRVAVVDARGRNFKPSLAGQAALEAAEGRPAPLCQPLRPDESYTTRLVFDLPADAETPRLELTTADAIALFVIGHESSPLHKKILFRLEPAALAAVVPAGERYER